MTVDLGTDLATLSDGDLDPTFALLSGPQLVARDLALRLQTPGVFYDESIGTDLRAWCARPLTDSERRRVAALVRMEARRDDRIDDVDVVVSGSQSSLSIAVDGTTVAGPFRLVLPAGELAARLQEPA